MKRERKWRAASCKEEKWSFDKISYIYIEEKKRKEKSRKEKEFRRLSKNFVAEMGAILQQKGERIKDILDKF